MPCNFFEGTKHNGFIEDYFMSVSIVEILGNNWSSLVGVRFETHRVLTKHLKNQAIQKRLQWANNTKDQIFKRNHNVEIFVYHYEWAQQSMHASF